MTCWLSAQPVVTCMLTWSCSGPEHQRRVVKVTTNLADWAAKQSGWKPLKRSLLAGALRGYNALDACNTCVVCHPHEADQFVWCCCLCRVMSCLQVFSQLGGLQLDRDIRSLVAAAGELTNKPVRDKFARLTQVGPANNRCQG
jgi:hypothetical protein